MTIVLPWQNNFDKVGELGQSFVPLKFCVVCYIHVLTKWLLPVFCLVAPTISSEVLDQAQNNGDTATFTCQATGEPVPTISWYFNGAPVDEANTVKYIISMMSLSTTTISNTLTIMNVESSDVGTYTCNATNAVSSDTSSGLLTINGERLLMW